MKYFSMFSGIGGFELGLENSKHDFENVGYCEIDKYAESIYRRHFPNHVGFGDATELETDEIDDFELLVGGFPCQAFSLSGKRQGFNDTRGTLFFEIARVLKDKRPRYFLLENVKGLLSHDRGRTFKRMLGVLSELGYHAEWQNYNSKDYGTAQNRERIYLKGYFGREGGREILSRRRSDRKTLNKVNTLVKNKQANSIHSIDGTSVTLCGEAGGQGGKTGLYAVPFNRQVKKRVHTVDYRELSEWLREHKKNANLSNKEISEKLDKPLSEVEHWFRTDEYFSPPSADVWFEFKELLNISDEMYDAFITEYELVDGVYEIDKRAYDENGLAPTIQTNGGSLAKINVVGNLSNTNHGGADVFSEESLSRTLSATDWKHPKMVAESNNKCFKVRRLTPKECERLQAFPDDWTKYGADGELISDTQRYKCLGNAVTTTVVTHIINNWW